MIDNNQSKYEILRTLTLTASQGGSLENSAQLALRQAAELVGLNAAALYLRDKQGAVTTSVSHSDSEISARRLRELEENLFKSLREEKELVSAYMSFGGEAPYHSFTLPLRHGDEILGAVIGLQNGDRTVVSEDIFLETLSAALALHAVVTRGTTSIPREALDKERLAAVVETAVTVNHEINNPLTAILGNVQLLLLKRDDLDEELRKKLEVIEHSAGRIRDVTLKLMKLTTARTVEYAEGTDMLDLSGGEEEPGDKDQED